MKRTIRQRISRTVRHANYVSSTVEAEIIQVADEETMEAISKEMREDIGILLDYAESQERVAFRRKLGLEKVGGSTE